MPPSASLTGSRENAPIQFLQIGEKGAVWPSLLLQHIVNNSDAVDLQVATARTRSCGRRLKSFPMDQHTTPSDPGAVLIYSLRQAVTSQEVFSYIHAYSLS
ncbi:hypothetical protein AVEN_20689-1 [Araneus ventricosus]|uniref:Uncharacterized protein n=1 Tax=Araneus ventricosus TaxID=182803 RepID=A0A4Y2U4C9_ARAVE|nr:hypothetical protein AVEN_20689-1 [Araneus ventricosus]